MHQQDSILPAVLCFASADPTGSGGVQADAVILSSLKCHPLSVTTAVQVKDSRSLEDYDVFDADLVEAQARALLEDIPVCAFRLGDLGSVENIAAIAEIFSDYSEIPVVVELSSPLSVCEEEYASAYYQALLDLVFPQAAIVIGSLAAFSLVFAASESESVQEQVLQVADFPDVLSVLGVQNALLTDTTNHSAQLVNQLFSRSERLRIDAWHRLPRRYAGARQLLSTAISAFLAQGVTLSEAVYQAQRFTEQALKHAYRPGMGLACANPQAAQRILYNDITAG